MVKGMVCKTIIREFESHSELKQTRRGYEPTIEKVAECVVIEETVVLGQERQAVSATLKTT